MLRRRRDRPLVYGTLGTHLNTDRAVFRAMLDGLADEDLDLVLTVGSGNDPAWVGPAPANARVERHISRSLRLDRCGAVVSHGGSGTILAALARQVPLVILPQGADNFVNAERCAAADAGIALAPAAVSAAAVRDAVRTMLTTNTVRAGAARVAREIAAMPEPTGVVPRLEELGGTNRL